MEKSSLLHKYLTQGLDGRSIDNFGREVIVKPILISDPALASCISHATCLICAIATVIVLLAQIMAGPQIQPILR